MGCPFGFKAGVPAPAAEEAPTGHERVRVSYEEYIRLPWLKQAWANPVTHKPVLEPCFAAACQSIEISFLLMSEFLRDNRLYVAKRPRIERVANDIRTQCQLLCELVDGELEEEEGALQAMPPPTRLSLTQAFPFEGCPPTLRGQPARSPGLGRLAAAIAAQLPGMKPAERNSLVKVVLNITSAFSSSFARWTVGLGIEPQLNSLLLLLGLPPAVPERDTSLDYAALVKPHIVERTLTEEEFTNGEDFFFRSIHLGAECWMFVALNRLRSALDWAASGSWHVASARILQAAGILNYLGDHILSLMSMNTRDYLLLKVELEGTSGAGSSQVKAARSAVMRLMTPLRNAVEGLGIGGGDPPGVAADAAGRVPGAFERGLMEVYENPDRHPGLYNYAKALEDIECALLGGFYYRHFRLAASIIGSAAPGTIKTSVAALKPSYEVALFPQLDRVRSDLGAKVDQDQVLVKGRMVDAILAKYSGQGAAAVLAAATAATTAGQATNILAAACGKATA